MDKDTLKKKAENLERELKKYASQDAEVKNLLFALSDILHKAKTAQIKSDLEWQDIPGGYLFAEGHLRQYDEIESAFAEFRIEATGGEPPALRKLRHRMEQSNR